MPSPLPYDLALVLLGDVSTSSRALRQVRALVDAGARVLTLGVGPLRDPAALADGVDVQTVEAPAVRGPAYFAAAHRALRRALRTVRARTILASDLHVLPACAATAAASGARLAYDAREYYPGLDAAGRPWVRWAWGAIERRHISRADRVFTVNGAIADAMGSRYGIAQPTVVRNVSDAPPDGLPATGDLRARLGLDTEAPLVLYQGLFREGRGLLPLADAMRDIPEAALVCIGEGPLEDALRERTQRQRLHLLPFTPPDALRRLTPDATLGAILARPLTESLRMGLPNKLFEYAAAGVPTLAGSGIEPLAALVRQFDAGIAVDPDQPEAVVQALRTALLDPLARARMREGARALHRAHSWERERETFLTALSPLLDADHA